jgi:hypothetical protein
MTGYQGMVGNDAVLTIEAELVQPVNGAQPLETRSR